MRLPAIAATALLLSGCGALPFGTGSQSWVQDAPAGLELTIEPQTAGPGRNATLAIYNGTSAPIGYNLCFGGLEQLRAGLWVPALTAAKNCPTVFYTLAPGERVSGETPIHAALAPGQYRYATRVSAPIGAWVPQQIRSNRFTIAEEPDG